jgi:hypothetical protein
VNRNTAKKFKMHLLPVPVFDYPLQSPYVLP